MKLLSLITLTLFLSFSFNTNASAQVFWEDDFENTTPNLGGGVRTAPNHANTTDGSNTSICGANDYFFRTDCNPTSGTPGQNCDGITDAFTGSSGFMWRGEDLDGCIFDPDIIDFTGIDITGRTNLVFKGLFAADDDANDWEGVGAADGHPDQLLVAYQIDGGGYTTGIVFRSDGSDHENTQDNRGLLRVDTDDDGFGDGPVSLGTNFQEFSFDIPSGGTTLDLRFEAFVNNGGEEFAIDLFQVEESVNPSICPTIGDTGASDEILCVDELFNVSVVGLENMAMSTNNDQNYGITFVAFDTEPTDPYNGGITLGTIPFNNLLSDGQIAVLESVSLPSEGNYMVYAILSITPTNPACRPFSGPTNLEVQSGSISISFPGDFCANDMPQTGLTGGLPVGGFYEGPGVTDDGNGMTYTFEPSVAGVGARIIRYTNVCGNNVGVQVMIFANPTVAFVAPGPFDIDAGIQTGQSGGTPEGGIYSGPGVVDDGNGMTFTFDPAEVGIGSSFVSYNYVDGNECSNSAQAEIIVEMIVDLPGNICTEAHDINTLFGQDFNVAQVSGIWDNTNYNTSATDPTTGYECFAEPDGNGGGASLERTIWYSFTGDGNSYKITTIPCNTTNYIGDGDTQMAIYSGECGSLVAVACNEDEAGAVDFRSSLELLTEMGTTYLVMIDGFGPDFPVMGEFCVEVINLSPTEVINLSDTDLRIFPNPTNGTIQLPALDIARVEVFDQTGRVIFSQQPKEGNIDLSPYPAGIYILKISTGDKLYISKLIKE